MNTTQLTSALLSFTREAYPNIEIQVRPWADDPERLAIYFADQQFSVLYPAQRYHYLAHLIPKDFFDEHLSNTVWFELAPGERPEALRYADEELISAITPEVMGVLNGSGALDALDDLMCPGSSQTLRASCFGDYRP